MNRVMKKFLGKLVEPFVLIAYTISAIGLTTWTAENVSNGWGIIVFVIMIPLPALAYMIRDTWRQAKTEGEWENRDMLNTLKGK